MRDQCDENLKSFAHMAVASLAGCTFCLDLGSFQADNKGLDVSPGSGLAAVRTAALQIEYANDHLHDPVWGMPPSSMPDDTGGKEDTGPRA